MNPTSVLRTAVLVALLVHAADDSHAQQQPPAPVVVAQAVQMEITAGQTFVATVMPLKRAVVGSAVDGRVVELTAQEGQRVEKSQPLVKLLTETVELELAAAEADLELRRQELAELENGTRPNEIDQARAKMLGAKASMEYEQTRLARLRQLRDSNATSQEDLDQARALADQAEQSYYDLKAAHELAVEGPRAEKIAQARAQVAFQQAVVDQIKDRIKKYTVISRFGGYVVAEHVDEGTWVKSGDPVMEVVALDEVELQAFVVEQHAAHIKLGAVVRVEVPALPQEIFTGTVTAVVPQADTRARTFPVKVRVMNKFSGDEPLLKAGMYARVELPVGSPQEAVMVPKDALVLGGPKPVVYVFEQVSDGLGKVQPVPVQPGVAMPNLIQATGALRPGQLVVVEGNERLRPGQEVAVVRVVQGGAAAGSDHEPQGASHATD